MKGNKVKRITITLYESQIKWFEDKSIMPSKFIRKLIEEKIREEG